MEKTTHEIRILAGIHAGAKMTASGSITVGSDSECDLVLNDPGVPSQAAVITIDKTGWSIKLFGKDYPLTLSYGDVFWIGIVPISVALVSQIWPKDIPPPEQTKQYSNARNQSDEEDDAEDELEDTALSTDDTDNTQDIAVSVSDEKDSAIIEVKNNTNSKAIVGFIGFLVVVLALIGVRLVSAHKERINSRQEAANQMNKLEYEVRAVLASEFARFNLTTTRSDSQKIIIAGYVPDRADVHVIERKLSPMVRNVVLHIFVSSEIAESVQEILKENFPSIKLKGVSLKGVVALDGFGSDSEVAQIESLLETNVMGVSSVDNKNLKSGTDIASEFEKEALKRGLSTLSFYYSSNDIRVSGSLNSSSMHIWDQLLSELSQKYKNVVSVSASIVEIPDKQPIQDKGDFAKKYAHAIYKTAKDYGAYGIYGVVNGSNKYIITEGGGRVMVGGRVGSFRLAEINDNEIVLDGPQKLVLRR